MVVANLLVNVVVADLLRSTSARVRRDQRFVTPTHVLLDVPQLTFELSMWDQ